MSFVTRFAAAAGLAAIAVTTAASAQDAGMEQPPALDEATRIENGHNIGICLTDYQFEAVSNFLTGLQDPEMDQQALASEISLPGAIDACLSEATGLPLEQLPRMPVMPELAMGFGAFEANQQAMDQYRADMKTYAMQADSYAVHEAAQKGLELRSLQFAEIAAVKAGETRAELDAADTNTPEHNLAQMALCMAGEQMEAMGVGIDLQDKEAALGQALNPAQDTIWECAVYASGAAPEDVPAYPPQTTEQGQAARAFILENVGSDRAVLTGTLISTFAEIMAETVEELKDTPRPPVPSAQ